MDYYISNIMLSPVSFIFRAYIFSHSLSNGDKTKIKEFVTKNGYSVVDVIKLFL